MQTLGISEATPRSESRLKSLFWPSIQSGADVDYLAVQGYWVCFIVGILSLGFLFMARQPVTGVIVFLLLYLGGMGVGEHSRFAAMIVLIYYCLDTIAAVAVMMASPSALVTRTIITALLLSNLRATWIASNWQAGSEEAALPPRMDETFRDKFVDQWPALVWPKLRIVYYIFSVVFALLSAVGIVTIVSGRTHL